MSTGRAAISGIKICVISNYYPPLFIGGYELGCKDVVEGLKARGHQVKVLTSTYNVARPQDDGEVHRRLKVRGTSKSLRGLAAKLNQKNQDVFRQLYLRIAGWWTNSLGGLAVVLKQEIANQRVFRRLCGEFNPDLIYVWNPAGISLSLVSVSQHLGLPVCYFISDPWLGEWERDPGYQIWQQCQTSFYRRPLSRGVLSLLSALNVLQRPASPDLRNVQFASEFLKRQTLTKGKPVSDAKVIHWGVDLQKFQYRETTKCLQRLLFVGQIVPSKGVHTAIEALKLLRQAGYESATLTIAGGSIFPEYETQIRQIISSSQLDEHVRFTGLLPREQLVSIYQQHDVLVFPSVWDEPFSITVLEAMASGLAVVGTPTGGSSEILLDGVNALVFQKEDAEACATHISRLFTDERFFEEIRRHGRLAVEQKYRLEQMVDSLENSLVETVSASRDRDFKRVLS
jgi:glycosyltransferase involved in cell wall biosynthesis